MVHFFWHTLYCMGNYQTNVITGKIHDIYENHSNATFDVLSSDYIYLPITILNLNGESITIVVVKIK